VIRRSIHERFWEKVDDRDPGGCHEWCAGRDKDGYGVFTAWGRPQRAHRVAWILNRGSIPEGMLVCHHCDNPPCVNPDHLFLGTHLDNVSDCKEKGRRAIQVQDAENPSAISVTCMGETHALAGWERRLGVRDGLLTDRIRRSGWDAETALKVDSLLGLHRDPILLRLQLAAREAGLPWRVVKMRIRNGWSVRTAITMSLVPRELRRKVMR
jgi:hypothetical protein